MCERLRLGIDLGTGSIKLRVVGEDGRTVLTASRPNSTFSPRPGWAEQDPEGWVDSVKLCLRELELRGLDPGSVASIGVAGQVDGAVAVGVDGGAVGNAIIWLDRRARRECEFIGGVYSDWEVYRRTGVRVDPSHVLPKLMWLSRELGGKRLKGFMTPVGYLVMRLTGQGVMDYTNASYTMAFDAGRRDYWWDIVEECGLDPSVMPPLVSSTDVVGVVTEPHLASRGYSKAEVLAGAGDQEAAFYASGLREKGACLDITGSAEPVCVLTTDPVYHPRGVLEVHLTVDGVGWLLENPGVTSGYAFRWFTRTILGLEDYGVCDGLASEAPPGSRGLIFVPCLSGSIVPEWDEHARGTFVGLSAMHSRGDMIRAIIEGTAYVLRNTVDAAGEAGVVVDRLVCTGGGSRSDVWMQVKADVTGLEAQRLADTDATSYGAALLGEPSLSRIPVSGRFTPDTENTRLYSYLYKVFLKTYYALSRDVFKHISNGV